MVFLLPKADGVVISVKAGMWVGEEKDCPILEYPNCSEPLSIEIDTVWGGISRSWLEALSKFKSSLIHQYSHRVFNQDQTAMGLGSSPETPQNKEHGDVCLLSFCW